MWKTLFDIFSSDLIGFALSATLLIAYHLFLRHKLKTNSAYTIHAINMTAPLGGGVMGREGQEVLAVQTLRSAIMGPTSSARPRYCS